MQIERRKPRCSNGERPYTTKDGKYVLGDPRLGDHCWHFSDNAIYADTVEKAVHLIETRGYGIRMHCADKRPSLIRPVGLRIVRP